MYSNRENNKVFVTIRCITYNHEPFIRKCLEGFVMQRTNFKFVAVVHDDASTDGTADIIREFEQKYPEIIKPIYETENQYSKRDGSLPRIMNAHMKGKYIACCEGDDYWTDPLKLQKQVDYLEANEDCSMVFTNATVKSELKTYSSLDEHMYDHLEERDYTGEEMLQKWSLPTASLMCKSEVFYNLPSDNRFIFGDIIVTLYAASIGRLHCINEKTVVYRRHDGGATTSKPKPGHFQRSWNHYVAIEEIFGKKYSSICKAKRAELLAGMFIAGKGGAKSFKSLRLLAQHPTYIYNFIKGVLVIVKNHRLK